MAFKANNQQLLDELEQNIVICRWRADQLRLFYHSITEFAFYVFAKRSAIFTQKRSQEGEKRGFI